MPSMAHEVLVDLHLVGMHSRGHKLSVTDSPHPVELGERFHSQIGGRACSEGQELLRAGAGEGYLPLASKRAG